MPIAKRRFGWLASAGWVIAAVFLSLAGLSACAKTDVASLSETGPQLDLLDFFEGESVAYGIFEDRFGNLRRRFKVVIKGEVEGDTLTLTEDFLYADGETQQRIWVITDMGQNEAGLRLYSGRAGDVMGSAEGLVAGAAMNWRYDVMLNIDGADWQVHFDDWIYQLDDKVAINRAEVRKFGLAIGSVTLVFLRGAAAEAVGPVDLENWSSNSQG
ncbi:MAG: DUF3833 domain-containing protein [Candidatus Puniceispirillaceae bacterium]